MCWQLAMKFSKNLFTLLLPFSFQNGEGSFEIVEVALVLSSSLQRLAADSVAAVSVRGAAPVLQTLCCRGLRLGKKAC